MFVRRAKLSNRPRSRIAGDEADTLGCRNWKPDPERAQEGQRGPAFLGKHNLPELPSTGSTAIVCLT